MRISSKRAAAICAALVVILAALEGGQVVVPPAVQPYVPLIVLGLGLAVAVLRPVESKSKKKTVKHD